MCLEFLSAFQNPGGDLRSRVLESLDHNKGESGFRLDHSTVGGPPAVTSLDWLRAPAPGTRAPRRSNGESLDVAVSGCSMVTSNTDQCAPSDLELQEWLGNLQQTRIAVCNPAVAYLIRVITRCSWVRTGRRFRGHS